MKTMFFQHLFEPHQNHRRQRDREPGIQLRSSLIWNGATVGLGFPIWGGSMNGGTPLSLDDLFQGKSINGW